MSESTPTKTLAKKLAAVMAAIGTIPKRGRNEFHKYDYATEADIVGAIRQQLAERHVVLLPSIVSEDRVDVGKTSSGNVKTLTRIEMLFTFIDGESGEEIDRKWRGVGIDSEDKGLYKAMTGGEKYFLLKTFLIPTGDDPEEHGEKDTPGSRGQRPQQKTAAAKPAAAQTAARPNVPAGAAVITNLVQQKRRGMSWADLTLSNGETVIAADTKVIAAAARFKQTGAPVALKTSVNAKGRVIVERIDAWPASEDAALDSEIEAAS